MDSADALVDIIDRTGRVIHQKPRREVNKRVDSFHSVHVVLMTPAGELMLSLIPQREDLPNLYAGLLGTTMATIRRHGETADQAAQRGLRRELLLENAVLQPVRDGMTTLEDGRRHRLTGYLTVAEQPMLYRLLDIGELVLMTPEAVETALGMHPDQFAPTLKAVWPSLAVAQGIKR